LALCRERGVRVFAYEDLSADYNVEWPRLLKHLGLPPERAAEKIQHEAAAPHVDLFRDERIIDLVNEVEAKAQVVETPFHSVM
jgi:hypothetical protein